MRAWGWRAAAAVVAWVAVVLAGVLLELDPHPGRVAVLVLVVAAGAGLLLDTVTDPPPRWRRDHPPEGGRGDWRDHDDRTASLLRLVESHLTARAPDPQLGRVLARLAAETLDSRHGVPADSAEGRAQLGRELSGLVSRPPQRLTRGEIARHLERIEAL